MKLLIDENDIMYWESYFLILFDLILFQIKLLPLLTSSHGLVVKAEDLWPRSPGFKPPLWRPFFRHHSFGDQSLEQKLWKSLTRHCSMCCNPANGRVDFEEWLAYKFQLHGIEWIVSLLADWDQSPTTTKKSCFRFDYISNTANRKARGGLTVRAEPVNLNL